MVLFKEFKDSPFLVCSFHFVLVVQDMRSQLATPAAMSEAGLLVLWSCDPRQTHPSLSCLGLGILSQQRKPN